MNLKGQLLYGEKILAQVATPQEIRAILSELKHKLDVSNPAFDLMYSKNIRLIVGLSPNYCWLHYMNEKTGYFLPIKSDAIEGTTYFMYGGHYTEVHLKNCVEYDIVCEVAEKFLSTGQLPIEIIQWEELK